MEQYTKNANSLWGIIKLVNLALAFILELCMLAALVYWGFNTDDGLLTHLLLGVGVPILVAVIWGVFRIPGEPGNAIVPVKWLVRRLIEWTLYGFSIFALNSTGQNSLATLFLIVLVINYIILYIDRLPIFARTSDD